MTVTDTTVWQAFKGLHRYFLPIGSAGKIVVPNALPDVATAKGVEAAINLANYIDYAWRTQPALVSPEYYTYLYLFCQSLRVSRRNNPTFLGHGKWVGLSWMPLHILAGRAELPVVRAWNKFYYDYIAMERPRPDQAALSKYFPWVPPYAVSIEADVIRQLSLLKDLKADGDSSTTVFRKYDSIGLTPPGKRRWHPLVVFSEPESWIDGGPAWEPYYQEALLRFLDEPDVWKLWKRVAPPAPLVLGQLNRYFRDKPRSIKTRFRRHWKSLNGYSSV